jgi:hypothetical protein
VEVEVGIELEEGLLDRLGVAPVERTEIAGMELRVPGEGPARAGGLLEPGEELHEPDEVVVILGTEAVTWYQQLQAVGVLGVGRRGHARAGYHALSRRLEDAQ